MVTKMGPVSSQSIVLGVPVHNESTHLKACLTSIRSQTFPDFAVIVVDNGSSDDSATIAAEFGHLDRRFHLIRLESNRGAAVSSATCLLLSQSPYFCFVGAHDLLSPNYLAHHLSNLQLHQEAALSFTTWEHIDESGNILGQVPARILPGAAPQNGCRWTRVLWSVSNHAVGSGLFHGVYRRSCIPPPPYPTVMAADHLFLTKVLFNGPAIELPGHLYQERSFARKPTGYMERITGQRTSRPSVLDLYREYIRWFDGLPESEGKSRHRRAFQRAVIRKCALSSRLWAHVNGARKRLGLGEPIR